jgi:predicted Rossmann-fold nucleotide-binding protein
MEKGKFISPGDLDLVTVTDDPQQTIQIIADYMRRVGTTEATLKTVA